MTASGATRTCRNVRYAPAATAVKPVVRKSRLWNAGGPAGLAALEARNAAERQAQLRHAPHYMDNNLPESKNDPNLVAAIRRWFKSGVSGDITADSVPAEHQ